MTTKKTAKPTTKKTTKPRASKPAPVITPATLYRTDGTSEQVLPTNGNHFTLEALQEYVGGDMIELLRSADGGTIMVVNEEGLLRKLPPNEKATNWAMREGASYSVIVGNVVIMNAKQIR